jgi:hypothetical protein
MNDNPLFTSTFFSQNGCSVNFLGKFPTPSKTVAVDSHNPKILTSGVWHQYRKKSCLVSSAMKFAASSIAKTKSNCSHRYTEEKQHTIYRFLDTPTVLPRRPVVLVCCPRTRKPQ